MTDKRESTESKLDPAANPTPENASDTPAKAELEAVDAEPEEPAGAEEPDRDQADADEAEEGDAEEDEPDPKPRPPAKLERLQKILAQAGVSSRRRAEELITQGRVQVNGKTVTELGTKADAGRDHIRVDGKLLQGAERLRYFVLNKPKGFVTTVKDPEGRPTVMKFFEKMRERLYPVGRLDYQSEGLLLVTNDGELANRLTKAASGVEKTYLVKVAGQPTEAELEILRGGVPIDRGQPGTERVRTAPARIRQVRQGDNPWYEVVLIEGRNRELRKMFEEIGHFVEKIRRVGYGPLVLDQEPGNLRELQPAELDALRKAAEGKYRTPKSKDIRRRNAADSGKLPTVLPKPSPRPSPRPEQSAERFAPRPAAADRFGDARPGKSFGTSAAGQGHEARPTRSPARNSDRSPVRRHTGAPGARPFPPSRPPREPFRPADRPATGGSAARTGSRPPFKRDDRSARPPARFAAGAAPEPGRGRERTGPARPPAGRSFPPKPAWKKPEAGSRSPADRSFPPKPAWKKPEAGSRPPYKRPTPRPAVPEPHEDLSARKPSQLHIEPVERSEYPDRPSRPSRPSSGGSSSGRTGQAHSGSGRSGFSRPPSSRPTSGRPSFERPGAGRGDRPARGESGLARPFTTSSGKPRAGGARPSSKPGVPPFKTGGRPFTGKPPAKSGSGFKPGFGGKPRPGGSSRPPSRSGPRPGGNRPGPPRGKRF